MQKMETERAKEGERRVCADQWDVDGWNLLASETERTTFATAQSIYERLVSQFPSNGKFWRMYADHMAREGMDKEDEVITLYNRAVTDAPTSIELWHSYNSFMTARALRNSGSPHHETQVIAVHERALSDAGLDVKADLLWAQYFNFLTNHATMSDSQRRDALKRLHQRAVILLHFIFPVFVFVPFALAFVCVLHTACPVFPLPHLVKNIMHAFDSVDSLVDRSVLPCSHFCFLLLFVVMVTCSVGFYNAAFLPRCARLQSVQLLTHTCPLSCFHRPRTYGRAVCKHYRQSSVENGWHPCITLMKRSFLC